MKTKEQMQLAINDIREVCKQHGVALLPEVDLDHQGYEIVLIEIEDLNTEPNALYFDGVVKPENLLITNRVIDHLNRNKDGSKALDRFTIKGVADVAGHTKADIIVSQHISGFSVEPPEKHMVDSLDDVEQLKFVRQFKNVSSFTHFTVDMNNGPFGTLLANYNVDPKLTPQVVGFIEGSNAEALQAKWPNPEKAK